VYQLEFQDLKVNPITGYIIVLNAKVFPRDTARQQYGYINSHFDLTTRKIVLEKVNLVKLLWGNALDLDKIEIVEPEIDFTIANKNPVFFPFRGEKLDTVGVEKKRALVSFVIKKLDLVDAHFHVINLDSTREGDLQGINLSFGEITIDRETQKDKIAYQYFDFSIGELNAKLKKSDLRDFHLKDFMIRVDSLYFEQTPDTVIYHFSDARTSGHDLDIQTSDSLFHIALDSFRLHYAGNAIELKNVAYKPNRSEKAIAARFPFRKEVFNVVADSIHVKGINFDSLMYANKIFVDEVLLDSVYCEIYKDLTRPFPPHHQPKYLGQQVKEYAIPVFIKHINVSHANLLNKEVTPDSSSGKVNITRGKLDIYNITNLPTAEPLKVEADAYVENSAHTNLEVNFRYDQSQFSIKGNVKPFELQELNPFINSYTPMRIKKGMSDGITFSGVVYRTYSTGNMKSLYHDLEFEMAPVEKVSLGTIIKAFVAKTIINNSNPPSPNLPTRVVQFHVDRDMRTGFIWIIVKSMLDGIQETFIMSKENKEVYREKKEIMKKREKEEKNAN
ncbi:MAG TPA: DUF748 domain-containing protein, partial [Saprospiraceae bacterium]|nr:DUF748 domain-containing protein [Saprospiraceae bacterium]